MVLAEVQSLENHEPTNLQEYEQGVRVWNRFDCSWLPGRFNLGFTQPVDMNVNVTTNDQNNANVVTNGENVVAPASQQVNTDGDVVSKTMNMSNVDDSFLVWLLYE